MIKANINELFPLSVSLVDDLGEYYSNQTVTYNIRTIDDVELSPTVSGTLFESTVASGIYKTELSLPESGRFIAYATCSGFGTNIDEIVINEENIYDLVKEGRHYNIAVQDVIREAGTPTASQLTRNVNVDQTDYVVTYIKADYDSDWSTTTVSGVVYAWYKELTDRVPYKMGGPS